MLASIAKNRGEAWFIATTAFYATVMFLNFFNSWFSYTDYSFIVMVIVASFTGTITELLSFTVAFKNAGWKLNIKLLLMLVSIQILFWGFFIAYNYLLPLIVR